MNMNVPFLAPAGKLHRQSQSRPYLVRSYTAFRLEAKFPCNRSQDESLLLRMCHKMDDTET